MGGGVYNCKKVVRGQKWFFRRKWILNLGGFVKEFSKIKKLSNPLALIKKSEYTPVEDEKRFNEPTNVEKYSQLKTENCSIRWELFLIFPSLWYWGGHILPFNGKIRCQSTLCLYEKFIVGETLEAENDSWLNFNWFLLLT